MIMTTAGVYIWLDPCSSSSFLRAFRDPDLLIFSLDCKAAAGIGSGGRTMLWSSIYLDLFSVFETRLEMAIGDVGSEQHIIIGMHGDASAHR